MSIFNNTEMSPNLLESNIRMQMKNYAILNTNAQSFERRFNILNGSNQDRYTIKCAGVLIVFGVCTFSGMIRAYDEKIVEKL